MGNTNQLYEGLKEEGLYTNSYEEFTSKYSTPEAINFLYEGLKEEGLYTNSIEEFNKKYFPDVKKKDSSESQSEAIQSDYTDTKLDGYSESTTPEVDDSEPQATNYLEGLDLKEVPVADTTAIEPTIEFDAEAYSAYDTYLKETEEEYNNLKAIKSTLTDPKDNIELLNAEESKRYDEISSKRAKAERYISEKEKTRALYEYEQSVIGTPLYEEFLSNIARMEVKDKMDDRGFWNWIGRTASYAIPQGAYTDVRIKEQAIDALGESMIKDAQAGIDGAINNLNKAADSQQRNVEINNKKIKYLTEQYQSGGMDYDVYEKQVNYLVSASKHEKARLIDQYEKVNKYATGLSYLQTAASFENLGRIEATVKGGSNELSRTPRRVASLLTAVTAGALGTIDWATFGATGTDYNQTTQAMMPLYNALSDFTDALTFKTDPERYIYNLTGETLVQLGEIVGTTMIAGPEAATILTAAMTHDEMMSDLLKNSDLTPGEANSLATAYAIVATPMEMIGARLGIEEFVTKGLKHNLVKMAKKEFFSGENILESVQRVLAPTFQQMMRASGIEGLEEGLTESFQTMAQEGIKTAKVNIDQFTQGENYKSRINLMNRKQFVDAVVESFLSGAYAGFLFGGAGSISNLGGTSSKFVGESLADPSTFASLQNIAKSKLDNLEINEVEYNTIMLNMTDARNAYTTTALIVDNNVRDEVMALSLQRAKVQRLADTDTTKKPLLKQINSQIAELIENSNSEVVSSASTSQTLKQLGTKYPSVANVTKMISSNQHVVESSEKNEDGKDIKTKSLNPKFIEALNQAAKDIDSEIAVLEESTEVKDKQALNDLYDIKRNMKSSGGSMFIPKSPLNTTKYTQEEQKRSATFGKIRDVLMRADDSGDVVTYEHRNEIIEILKQDGYNPNLILDLDGIIGKPISEVNRELEVARGDFGQISDEHRFFNDAQIIAERQGVESKIVRGLQRFGKSKGYTDTQASEFAESSSVFITQLAAKSGKTKNEVYTEFMAANTDINQTIVDDIQLPPTVKPIPESGDYTGSDKKYWDDINGKFQEDGKGNFVFTHYSHEQRDVLSPSFAGTNGTITQKEEARAMATAGGLVMFYTEEGFAEPGTGSVKHTVTVPKDKVYIFNSDVNDYYEEAKIRFLEENPGQAFTANHQVAWITKVANANGYQMVVSVWGNYAKTRWRAQTNSEIVPNESNKMTQAGQMFKAKTGRGAINPMVQMVDVYQQYMSEEEKAVVLAWTKEPKWTQNTSRKFTKAFLKFLETGESIDSKAAKAMASLKEFMGNAFSVKDPKLSNPMKNLMAKVTGDFTREERIKKEEAQAKMNKNLASQEEFKAELQERVKTARGKEWADSVKGALPKSRFANRSEFEEFIMEGDWAMLTGENPNAQENVTADRNKKLNKKAEKWLKQKGYSPLPIYGWYGSDENSFFVEGMTRDHVVEFAKEFNQESVAASDGFVYQDGTVDPRIYGNEKFHANEGDYYSTINVDGGPVDFQIDYDFRSGSNSVTRKELLLVDKDRRKQALSRLSIDDQNNIKALELANIDLVALNSVAPKAGDHIIEALTRFVNDGDVVGLNSKSDKIPMDKYIAYNRLNEANLRGMKRFKNLKLDSGVTRAFMSMFADTQVILRSALSNYSTSDILNVMDAIGFNRYAQGVARSMTDIESTTEIVEEITKFLEDNKVSDVDAKSTQVFMAETTFVAMLLSPNTKMSENLNAWFNHVMESVEIHQATLITRGKNNPGDKSIERENTNSRQGSTNAYMVFDQIQKEMELADLDIAENWDIVIEKLKEYLPKQMELVELTSSMHRTHASEVLNYKKRIGDSDTYAGEYYNSRSLRDTNGDELGFDEKTDHFDTIMSSTGSLEDRTASKIPQGSYIPTWAFIATQQRAYNLSSRLMYTGEAIRQMSYATNTNSRNFAGLSGSLAETIGEEQVKLIRKKIRSMVNFSAAADEIRMFSSSSSGFDRQLKNVVSRVALMKNQLLMSMKQPFVQASVASFAMATMPVAFVTTMTDLKTREHTGHMMSLVAEESSLGARNASYFIKSTTSSAKEIVGGIMGSAANRVIGNATQDWQEMLLSKPDVAVATTTWLAAYKDKRIEQSGRKDFNWKEEAANPNREAINYAEMMQQSSQASNVKEAGSEFSTSNNEMWSLVRELVFPFKFFDNSFRTNLLTDLSLLRHDSQAWKRVLGYSTIPAAYASVKWTARVKMVQAASFIVSQLAQAFNDDEEKKDPADRKGSYMVDFMKSTLGTANKRLNTPEVFAEYLGEQVISDFAIGWVPYMGTFDEIRRPAMFYGINLIDYNFGSSEFNASNGDSYDLDNKELYRTFDEFVKSEAPAFQIFNGGKNFEYIMPPLAIFMRGVEAYNMYQDGYMDLKGGGRYFLSEDDKETAFNMAMFDMMSIISPLQELRQVAAMTHRDLLNMHKGYKFLDHADKGEFEDEWNLEMYVRYMRERGEVKPYGEQQFGSATKELSLKSRERNLGVANVQYNNLLREYEGIYNQLIKKGFIPYTLPMEHTREDSKERLDALNQDIRDQRSN